MRFLAEHGSIRHALCHGHTICPRERVEFDIFLGVMYRLFDLLEFFPNVSHQPLDDIVHQLGEPRLEIVRTISLAVNEW
jgi:hypothetical protein